MVMCREAGGNNKDIRVTSVMRKWAFVAPYLTLMREDALQWDYPMREVFNRLRWVIRTGAQWRFIQHVPPWATVYQRAQP